MKIRQKSRWKLASLGVFAVAGGIGVVVGCSGGSGDGLSGSGNGTTNGQLTNQTVPRLIVNFGLVYGARGFYDSLNNYLSQKGVSDLSSNRFPQSVTNGCPAVTDDKGDNGQKLGTTHTITLSYDGCKPPPSKVASRGAVTIRQENFAFDANNQVVSSNQRFNFSPLDFGGQRFQGEVEHRVNLDPFQAPGQPLDAEERYEWSNLVIGTVDIGTNTVENSTGYDGVFQLLHTRFPFAGKANVVMTVNSQRTFTTTKWGMEMNYNSVFFTGPNGTRDADTRLNGTATADATFGLGADGTQKSAGKYTLTATELRASDACDSADNGSVVIKGANGEARVTFGPACGQAQYSINGAAPVKFNAATYQAN